MKILVIGKKGGILHWYENVLDALSLIDDVEVYQFSINYSSITDSFVRKSLGLLDKNILESYLTNKLENLLKKDMPDIVLFVDLVSYHDFIFDVIKKYKSNFNTAIWIGDLFDEKLINSFKSFIDLYLFTDSYFINLANSYNIANSYLLPLAYNEKIFKNITSLNSRKNRLLFIGSYSLNRGKIVENIEQQIVVIGKKWSQIKSNHEVISKRVSISTVANYYNKYQAILNIKNSDNVVNGINMRTFDSLASGCILFNDYLEDINLYFDVKKDLVIYRDIDELNFLYKDYLNNPTKYYNIAENGFKKCHQIHSYKNRMYELISLFN